MVYGVRIWGRGHFLSWWDYEFLNFFFLFDFYQSIVYVQETDTHTDGATSITTVVRRFLHRFLPLSLGATPPFLCWVAALLAVAGGPGIGPQVLCAAPFSAFSICISSAGASFLLLSIFCRDLL